MPAVRRRLFRWVSLSPEPAHTRKERRAIEHNAEAAAAVLKKPSRQSVRVGRLTLTIGVFFGSLHGTLNHLLLTDRLWLKRLTGEGDHPGELNAILYEDRAELTRARIAEDDRLIAVVERYDEAALASLHSYKRHPVCRSHRSFQIFCCIYSIIRPIIADRHMPACRY